MWKMTPKILDEFKILTADACLLTAGMDRRRGGGEEPSADRLPVRSKNAKGRRRAALIEERRKRTLFRSE
jgi:hypothetical protein